MSDNPGVDPDLHLLHGDLRFDAPAEKIVPKRKFTLLRQSYSETPKIFSRAGGGQAHPSQHSFF
jgi:hypothetical protein